MAGAGPDSLVVRLPRRLRPVALGKEAGAMPKTAHN